MNILVVTQYFWPETFRINDLVGELVRRGHKVTVLTGYPNYPDGEVFADFQRDPKAFASYEGAEVLRVPLSPRKKGALRLGLNYLSFAVNASVLGPFRLRGRPVDAIFAYEPSPITVGVPAIVMKMLKRAPIAFWVLDLWPQTLKAVGVVKSGAALWAVDQLVRMIYAGCDLILAQSRSFVPQIARQVRDPAKIAYFPSWADPQPSAEATPPASEVAIRPDLFTIVFTGNIGEAQDFPAILEAAATLRDQPVRWVIVGDGRKADWVRARVEELGLEERVLLVGRFPLERMPSFIRHADALLVSLRAEPIFAFTIPGKVQGYLAAGVPVLSMIDGETAEVITSAGAGLAVPAGDAKALAAAALRLAGLSGDDLQAMGARGRTLSETEFNREALIGRLETWLEGLVVKKREDRQR